ncbi:MAG: GtrA family protein [Bacilli bacterium]
MEAKNKTKEFFIALKFLMISISAGIVEIVSFTLLNELSNFPYWPSYLIALILSIVWNFTINRRYTFKSANNVPVAMLLVFAFYAVFTPASTLMGDYLADTLLWNEYLVTVLIMVTNFLLEYPYQRYVVFRKTLNTNQIAKRQSEKSKIEQPPFK